MTIPPKISNYSFVVTWRTSGEIPHISRIQFHFDSILKTETSIFFGYNILADALTDFLFLLSQSNQGDYISVYDKRTNSKIDTFG